MRNRLLGIILTFVLVGAAMLPAANAFADTPVPEDFTTYTETDPENRVTVNSGEINFSNVNFRGTDTFVYMDKGEGHFSGDFEHLLTFEVSSLDTYALPIVWMLANTVDDRTGMVLGGQDYLDVEFYLGQSGLVQLRIQECVSGVQYEHTWTGASVGTTYYLKIERDEDVGEHGRLYCYIYSDPDRTSLLQMLQLDLHEKEDFRYIYVLNTHNDSQTYQASGSVMDLNLQEENYVPPGYAPGDSATYYVRYDDDGVPPDYSTEIWTVAVTASDASTYTTTASFSTAPRRSGGGLGNYELLSYQTVRRQTDSQVVYEVIPYRVFGIDWIATITHTYSGFPSLPLQVGQNWTEQAQVSTTSGAVLDDWYDCIVTGTGVMNVSGCGDIPYVIVEKWLTATNGWIPGGGALPYLAHIEYWPSSSPGTCIGPLYEKEMRYFTGVEEMLMTGSTPCPPVPQIATIVLMSLGLVGLSGYVWFRRRQVTITSV